MLSSDKAAKGVGVDVVGEAEAEAKEETVAVRELVEDSNSAVVPLVVQSKLRDDRVPSFLAAATRNSRSCMYSDDYWRYAVSRAEAGGIIDRK